MYDFTNIFQKLVSLDFRFLLLHAVTCQSVAGASVTSQFHDFFRISFLADFFAIKPNMSQAALDTRPSVDPRVALVDTYYTLIGASSL